MLESPLTNSRIPSPASLREADGYVISGFTHEDAADIPRAFTAVYGENYLSPLVYDAEAFAKLNSSGEQISLIARGPEGDLAGHVALAFSSPNRGVVELCQGIVTPDHRKSGIFVRMIDRALDYARDTLRAQAVLGISLTNHIISQKVVCKRGFRDVGLEVDYVPQRMLKQEAAEGPAATLLQYLDLAQVESAPCHLPPSYAVWFARLLDGAAVCGHRQITPATELDRRASVSEAKDMPRFDMARLLVHRAGFDFWSLVGDMESQAEAAGRRSFQVLINLGNAEGAAAVELLRGWGYACSGLLPNYLEGGQHVAILFRSFDEPYFQGVKLHSEEAERLLGNVVSDWQRAERLGAELRHVFDDTTEENTEAALDQPSLETARNLLGIDGRIPLETGGMLPAALEDDDALSDSPHEALEGDLAANDDPEISTTRQRNGTV